MVDPHLERGPVSAELAADFPELSIWSVRVDGGPSASPPDFAQRLRDLADRFSGGHVVHMRQDTVPWAYRVFWRQIGVDPDTDRTPVEALAVERLRAGGLPSRNRLDDAVTIATLETGVGLLAFDAQRVGKEVGLRLAVEGELLGGSGRPLAAGQIVLADELRTLATPTGEVARERGVSGKTRRTLLAALGLKGVAQISVEEALWSAAEMLEER